VLKLVDGGTGCNGCAIDEPISSEPFTLKPTTPAPWRQRAKVEPVIVVADCSGGGC
jgi:hypothetical protein